MPTNNPYNNDPYGELTATDMVREVALSPFKLGTYAALYSTVPAMWSIEKGVRIPYFGRYLENPRVGMSALKNIGQSYKGRGVIGGTATAASRTFGSLKKGGGFVGKKFFDRTARINTPGIYDEAYSFFSKTAGLPKDQTAKYASRIAKTGTERIKQGKNLMLLNALKKGDSISGSSPISTTMNLSKFAPKTAIRTSAKLAIGGAKALSMVGAAVFAWDIIKMIGEPLGQAAMSKLSEAAQDAQNRFMPETGGDLSVAYLSQQAATERQRAVQAMSKASITGRSAFGQEAAMMHR